MAEVTPLWLKVLAAVPPALLALGGSWLIGVGARVAQRVRGKRKVNDSRW